MIGAEYQRAVIDLGGAVWPCLSSGSMNRFPGLGVGMCFPLSALCATLVEGSLGVPAWTIGQSILLIWG